MLTSAAMMDDVVGLVMVQVISNLGGNKFSWVTIVRPVLVSVAFAAITPFVCLCVVKPVTSSLNRHREMHPNTKLNYVLSQTQTVFAIHTLLLIGLVAVATYAGTSNLFAAYIAGATISWWDSEVPHPVLRIPNRERTEKGSDEVTAEAHACASTEQSAGGDPIDSLTPAPPLATKAQDEVRAPQHSGLDTFKKTGGSRVYEIYYHEAVSKILQPLFFASIGFSIPITRMFQGTIVWRGLVYALLMAFAKFVCGFWLVRFSASTKTIRANARRLTKTFKQPVAPHMWGKSKRATALSRAGAPCTATASITPSPSDIDAPDRPCSLNPRRPVSLQPPLILACAMCARGEIGFLISGVAESNGVFSGTRVASSTPSDIFLVVTWAIVLCTIVGPLGVGLSVRRVKKLQERKNWQQDGAGRDVLGVWGVD